MTDEEENELFEEIIRLADDSGLEDLRQTVQGIHDSVTPNA